MPKLGKHIICFGISPLGYTIEFISSDNLFNLLVRYGLKYWAYIDDFLPNEIKSNK